MGAPHMRDFRYDSEAANAIEAACETWTRTDDAVFLIEWAITRDPTEGKSLTESGDIRQLSLQGAVSIQMPTVTFVYEIDPHYITVKEARFETAKPQKTIN